MSASGPLSDIDHIYGEDLGVTPSGDLALVSGDNRTQERLIRRLCTNPTTSQSSDYPWEPTYGAGLGQKIGQQFTGLEIQGLVTAQVRQEPSVAALPAPIVTVTELPARNGANINIQYWDNSGVPANFSFDLGP